MFNKSSLSRLTSHQTKHYLRTIQSIIAIIILFTACKSHTDYGGDSMVNYPDMEMIWRENVTPYQQDPHTFRLVVQQNKKADTTYPKANQVDWASLKKPFQEASINQVSLDHHYSLDVFIDSASSSSTLLLSAISPKDFTKKMSVSAPNGEHQIKTLYAEANESGFFSSKAYKLLLVRGKTIQIQESSKRPFSSLKTKVTTLTFLN